MKIFFVSSLLLANIVVADQFQNLTLDNVNTNAPLQSINENEWIGKSSDLIPGWSVSINGVVTNSVGYSYPGHVVAVPGITVISHAPQFAHSLFFESNGGGRDGLVEGLVAISQRGVIPVDAKWISLDNPNPSKTFNIYINGVDLGYVLGQGRMDISKFSGQEVNLSIGTRFSGTLDGVSFISVPEPSTVGLVLVGSVVIWSIPRGKRT